MSTTKDTSPTQCDTQPKDEMTLTDSEMLIGLVNLVSAVAERLTGHTPTLRIDSRKGHFFVGMPRTRYVTWEPLEETPESRSSLVVGPQEANPTPPSSSRVPDARQEEFLQTERQ